MMRLLFLTEEKLENLKEESKEKEKALVE